MDRVIASVDQTDRSAWAQRYLCGTEVGREGTPPPKSHACHRTATRVSHVYERFSVYVCDVDHEGLEPWTEDLVEDLPAAAAIRAELAAEGRRRASIETFRRAMRRHEARAMRLDMTRDGSNIARQLRKARLEMIRLPTHEEMFTRIAANAARRRGGDWDRRMAHVYRLAAATIAKLRDALRCPHHGSQLDYGWQGWKCEECEREWLVARGCRCCGTVKCPECIAARAAGTGEKCRPDCSDLCHVCCPDD